MQHFFLVIVNLFQFGHISSCCQKVLMSIFSTNEFFWGEVGCSIFKHACKSNWTKMNCWNNFCRTPYLLHFFCWFILSNCLSLNSSKVHKSKKMKQKTRLCLKTVKKNNILKLPNSSLKGGGCFFEKRSFWIHIFNLKLVLLN